MKADRNSAAAEALERSLDHRRGWTLPFAMNEVGGFPSTRRDLLEDTIRLVVEVHPGERALLPEFGCRVHSLDSILTESERQIAAALIEESLDRWAPWLGIERVEVLDAAPPSMRLEVLRQGERRRLRIAWFGGRGDDGVRTEQGSDGSASLTVGNDG